MTRALAATLAVVVTAACSVAGEVGTPESRPAPVISTQAFETGELQMATVDAKLLEVFLRDLNKRKDYDASQNGGKAGPDGPYLAAWVEKVTKELLRRGYGIDEKGQLRRPGEVVPWR